MPYLNGLHVYTDTLSITAVNGNLLLPDLQGRPFYRGGADDTHFVT